MLILISPAKTLDYESPVATPVFTQPEFLSDSRRLIKTLRQLNPEELCNLMHISSKLGELNFQRNLNWHTPFAPDNARQAIFAFRGDVYLGLRAEQFSDEDLAFAQQHLRILSGLYGILRPLDLMQPYRLEMGTALKTDKGDSLYEFWGSKLTRALQKQLAAAGVPVVINLASNEYFNVLQPDKLKADIVTPQFKDFSNGKYRFLSFFAKQARGLMAAWIIRQRITDPQRIAEFNVDGYRYSKADSTSGSPVFLRKKKA
ncbi:MAG: hypothetical protein RLZZ385_1857 [Pseudomonadota bacterium]|jgi:cytoplasmic iron level regulating protein YaaA (DUF328/UPF0246 family)